MAGAATLAGLLALAAGTLCLTSGCASVGYLAQSVGGHVHLLNSARPIDDWLAAPDTPAPLKARLALSQQMRDFAVRELKLPDNRSYRTYADLKRPAAVWNVAAAPELSLRLHTWCFPVVGCIAYRGFYDQAAAEAEAQALRDQGLEASVYPVPAYSTLGKMEWLGGDPLLNTFVGGSEAELASLIFHELAHQVAYAESDTAFNESFATAVERLGIERWLNRPGGPGATPTPAARAAVARRDQVRAMTRRTRAALEAIYRSDATAADKRSRKAQVMAALRAEHAALKAGEWGGFAGYDAFFSGLNNATLAMQGSYQDGVPAFVALFEREGRDFGRFYAAVQALAGLPRAQRAATLQALVVPAPPAPAASAAAAGTVPP